MDSSKLDISKVVVFSKVKVVNKKINKEFTYQLVSETEANLKEMKISVTSPIGKGLLGKKIGEIAEVETPGGNIQFEILHISI